MRRDSSRISVIQVSPYPPEAGSIYHETLCKHLTRKLKRPIIVLAGVTHLPLNKAMEMYGRIERRDDRIIVYRAFWIPRLVPLENRSGIVKISLVHRVLKLIFASIKALLQAIKVAKKVSGEVVVHIHYRFSTWPGGVFGEHYALVPFFAHMLGAKVICTIHDFALPHQIILESRRRKLPWPLTLAILAYYLIITRIATSACNTVTVLTNSNTAPIVNYIKRTLILRRVIGITHPRFEAYHQVSTHNKHNHDRITVLCPGYIRREKGYHVLLDIITRLSHHNPSLLKTLKVIIAGNIDRKKLDDIVYLKELLSIIHYKKLNNVTLIIKKLTEEELHMLFLQSNIIWCAYNKQYGPSGILALARAYNKKVLYPNNALWGNAEEKAPNFSEHVDKLLSIYYESFL